LAKVTSPKLFYGYIVVATSIVILVILHGTYQTYGVFFNSLLNQFQTNRATISGAQSLTFFFSGLFALAYGRLTDRFGPKVILAVCGFIFGSGYIVLSHINSLWQLYLFYPLIVGMGMGSGDVSILSTTARWFVKRRGLMSSIVKVGTGTGMFIMPLIASWLITSHDWRTAYLVLGITAIIVIVPTAMFLRRDPGEMGLKPYGMYEANGAVSKLASRAEVSFQDAVHTRQFWAICGVYFVVWYSTQSIMVHTVPHAVDSGILQVQAASIMSVIGGVSIGGRLLMGSTSDKLGNRWPLIACLLIFIASLSWLQYANKLWMLYLFAAVYGFAHGGFFAIISPLVAELFGTAHQGANLGMVLFIGQVGGAIGPVITGRLYDVLHNYQVAFLILVAISVGALILTFTQIKPVQNKQPKPLR
jgi:MFS family permease